MQCPTPVFASVLPNDVINRFFDLLFLLDEVFFGSAPLFGGVGGKLAAVNGKHLFPDQAHLIADQKHVAGAPTSSFLYRGVKIERSSSWSMM